MLLCKKRDTLLRRCMGKHSDSEEGRRQCSRISNSFTMKKVGAVCEHHDPKVKTEGLLAFVVPSAHL